MKAIIMCAGKSSRWKTKRGWKVWDNYLGVRKQLIKVGGETLLHRTCRLLRERGVEDIVITIASKEDSFPTDEKQEVNVTTMEIERFYPQRGKVIYLYGDVYYTYEAMDTIVNKDGVFFGRNGASKVGGKGHSELFAVKGDGETIQKYVEVVKKALKSGKCKRGIGWDLYKAYYGEPFKPEKVKNKKHIVDINDATDDFDKPSDYDTWIKSNAL